MLVVGAASCILGVIRVIRVKPTSHLAHLPRILHSAAEYLYADSVLRKVEMVM